MAFLEWTNKNKINVRIVDEQHKKLFSLLNALHKATVNGEERSSLTSIMDELIEYTVYHFRTEEKLCKKHDYPNYVAHTAIHNKLTEQALELQQQCRVGSATISFDLLDFMHGWLVNHTTGIDKEVGAHLNKCGIF